MSFRQEQGSAALTLVAFFTGYGFQVLEHGVVHGPQGEEPQAMTGCRHEAGTKLVAARL